MGDSTVASSHAMLGDLAGLAAVQAEPQGAAAGGSGGGGGGGGGLRATNLHGESAVHSCGTPEALAWVAAQGGDIEAETGTDGRRPVHIAAMQGDIPMLERLASLGADLGSRSGGPGQLPLHFV